MESERDEELRVLFAAAEKGRADIINTVVAALAAKPGADLLFIIYDICPQTTSASCVMMIMMIMMIMMMMMMVSHYIKTCCSICGGVSINRMRCIIRYELSIVLCASALTYELL